MAKDDIQCWPLEKCKELKQQRADVFDIVDQIRERSGKQWDPACWMPTKLIERKFEKPFPREGIKEIERWMARVLLTASIEPLAIWRQWKQIYRFDEDFEQYLLKDISDLEDPVEVLKAMPYPCIYVETKHVSNMKGFFAMLDWDIDNDNLMLTFYGRQDPDVYPKEHFKFDFPVKIRSIVLEPGKTISQSIVPKEWQEMTDFAINEKEILMIDEMKKEWAECKGDEQDLNMVMEMLQLVLYICAANAEVEENPKQKAIHRAPKPNTKVKDKLSEVQAWDAGQKTGERIRILRAKPANYTGRTHAGTSSPKSPHFRRGHWHHYWVGKKDSEERKVKLNWVSPMFINGEDAEEQVTVTVATSPKQK